MSSAGTHQCSYTSVFASVVNIPNQFTYMGRVAQSVWRLSCELDSPVSNPDGDETFRQSRPSLGPNESSVKWVPGVSRG